MSKIILMALLSFQVNAAEITKGDYVAVGYCKVMLTQLRTDNINPALLEYWKKLAEGTGQSFAELHKICGEAIKEYNAMDSNQSVSGKKGKL